jgi:hypothetical protein
MTSVNGHGRKDDGDDPAQRMRAHRVRRRRREVQLTIEVTKTDLLEIAKAGYPGAASTDRKAREEALRVYISDQCVALGK